MAPKKLKGGALYIALIVCMVTGITLGIFIMIAGFNQRRVIRSQGLSQLELDLQSGFNMARSGFFSEAVNNKWMGSEFNDDSIRIKKMQWGAYSLISVEAKDRHHFTRRAALYGSALFADTSIVVAEKGRPVGVAGKIKFTAAAYIPKGAIKPAYIEGQNYIADGPVSSFLRLAPPMVPEPDPQFLNSLEQSAGGLNASTDSLVAELPPVTANDFSKKTIVLEKQNFHMEAVKLKGNIKLKCAEVVISNTSETDNILIICDKLKIRKGFKGRLQAIARDSIVLEDECELYYPSSLCLLRSGNSNEVFSAIITGEKCVVHGSLLAVSKEPASQRQVPKVLVKLNRGLEVYGFVYSSGYLNLQGTIYGNALCQALLLNTASATYENHMLGVTVDPKAYRNSVAIPAMLKAQTLNRCIKWL